MQYRREVDGLRSIAVGSVILYHAGLSLVPAGYLGVDVFFVISGFLITSILLRDLADGDFSIARFYERRARRILPALFLVTMLAAIPAAFLLLPTQLVEFGHSLVATAAFVSNLQFAGEVEYFTNATDLKPLIHTWSLAVEEQFYIFFPPLLLLLFRWRGRGVAIALLVITAASLAAAQIGAALYPDENFFLTHGRVWELAIGSLAAVLQFYRPQPARPLVAALGLAMIVLPILFYGPTIISPTLYTAVPVLGTALVLLFAQGNTLVGRLLALPPLVFIGLISYSAYLWHQPLFAYARIYFNGEAPATIMAGLTVLTIVLSYLSWRFVETPARRASWGLLRTRGRVFALSATAMAIMIVVGLAFASGAIKSRVEVDALVIDPVAEWQASNRLYIQNPLRWLAGPFGNLDKVNVAIIGDSHSVGTFNMLRGQQDAGLKGYDFAHAYFPMNCLRANGNGGSKRDAVQFCFQTWDEKSKDSLFEQSDVFVYSMRWMERAYLIPYLPELIAWGNERGIRTVVLSNMQEWTKASPAIISEVLVSLETSNPSQLANAINRHFQQYLKGAVDDVNAALKPFVEGNGGLFLSKQDYSCEQDVCFGVSGDLKALHTDYGHETINGAQFYGQRIVDLGWFTPVSDFVRADAPESALSAEANAQRVSDIMDLLGVTEGVNVQGSERDDKLVGSEGNDSILGLEGNDDLDGLEGDNLLSGGPGNDTLRAGSGENRLYGDAGDDIFYPGPGVNTIWGGDGADLLVVTYSGASLNVEDFVPGQDRIDLRGISTSEQINKVLDEAKPNARGNLILRFGDTRVVFRSTTIDRVRPLFIVQ
jgi:peptidoglycan/LPS O-acetylase OafA/YrhL